ncbi:MAG: hypothetical protein RIQ71_2697 [Verrucomicrobiota bacterium]
MNTAAYWWNFISVFLLLVWLLQRFLREIRGLFVSALGAGLVSLIPFFGHEPRYWLSGLTPNVSIPLLALLLASILARARLVAALRPREWRAAWSFGALAALALYPSALGLGLHNFDSYSLGWPWQDWSLSSLLFGAVALTAGILIWRENRFGWVLVCAALAYVSGLQESQNFWDYVVDPLYAVVSLAVCMVGLARRIFRR